MAGIGRDLAFSGIGDRGHAGRPKITAEIRTLIHRLAEDNASWGAPKIHGELLKLGFNVSETTVARYLRGVRRRGDPGKTWTSFLLNHREVIAAFDFFTVPTVTFKLLYCFFVIEHGRRKSCIVMSLTIRRQSGSCNNCERRFQRLAHTDT